MSDNKEWHYIYDGREAGPITADELDNLLSKGIITPADSIWREGMDEWAPYHQARHTDPAPPKEELPSFDHQTHFSVDLTNEGYSSEEQAEDLPTDGTDEEPVHEEAHRIDPMIEDEDPESEPDFIHEPELSEDDIEEEAPAYSGGNFQKDTEEIKKANVWLYLTWIFIANILFVVTQTFGDAFLGRWEITSATLIVFLLAYWISFPARKCFVDRNPTNPTRKVALILSVLFILSGILGIVMTSISGPSNPEAGQPFSRVLSVKQVDYSFRIGILGGGIWSLYVIANARLLRRKKKASKKNPSPFLLSQKRDEEMWDALNRNTTEPLGLGGFAYFLTLFLALWGVYASKNFWYIPLALFGLIFLVEHIIALFFGTDLVEGAETENTPLGYAVSWLFGLLTFPVCIFFLVYWLFW